MPTDCRLIVDPPESGPWNMAVDEVLLDTAADRDTATLRFYAWIEPTLSLGYFQPCDDRARHPASKECAVVRRSSGGGAILHHREITYSFAVPSTHPFARRSEALYEVVHRALVSTLGDLTGGSTKRMRMGATSDCREEPFLCFMRRAASDVVVDQTAQTTCKIAGSAQRRRRGAVLQHGSIILAESQYAPELPGIQEVFGQIINPVQLIQPWAERVCRVMELESQPGFITEPEANHAARIAAERFASPAWTNRR